MQKYGALRGIETCRPTLGHGALATKGAQHLFLGDTMTLFNKGKEEKNLS